MTGRIKLSLVVWIKFILLLILSLLVLNLVFNEVHRNNIIKHFPNNFIAINIEGIPQDKEIKPTIIDNITKYEVRYTYNNIEYTTKISQSEFNQQFYISNDRPSEAYSESDIRNNEDRYMFRMMIYITLFIALLIAAFCNLGYEVAISRVAIEAPFDKSYKPDISVENYWESDRGTGWHGNSTE